MVIQLISGPRNISTALMYSFAQRRDMSVVDEPLYAYYLTKTGLPHPGRQEVLDSQSSNAQQVINQVILGDYPTPHVFIKNMSKHIEGLDLGYCKQVKNVFLIRDPERLIASFAKVVQDPDESEIGLIASWKLFQLIPNSIVLNSDEVLKNPSSVLENLCDQLGIPFDEKMLSWTAGARKEDGVWAPYWYKNVHKSTGFQSSVKSSDKVPSHLLPLLEEVLPYYQKLNQFAIKS